MGLLLALVAGLSVQAQDPAPGPSAEVVSALQKTARKGTFGFAGTLRTEVDPDNADEEATVCTVSGAVTPGSVSAAEIKGDHSVHELVVRRNRMAGRETWKGHPLDLANAPGELMSLLDLDRLALAVKDATSVKSLPDEKSGAEEYRVYELALPKSAIRSYHDDAETAEEEEKSVRGVTLGLRLRKADGLVASIDAAVRRLYKEDDKPGDGTKALSVYSLRLKDFGTAQVSVPPALEKLLKD